MKIIYKKYIDCDISICMCTLHEFIMLNIKTEQNLIN